MKKSINSVRTVVFVSAAVFLAPTPGNAGQGPQPSICTRSCWGARNTSCSGTMSSLSRAIVHHTAGSGDWTTDYETGKAKVRGVQNLHMDGNGWCDIGYHFLITAGGHIYEGRKNSMSGLPTGAHDGCNSSSFGFSVLGYYHSPYNQTFTAAARSSVEAVIAWRMPSAWSPYNSGSYCGKTVGTLDGHYKVKSTACPGTGIINFLGAIRDGVNARKNGSSTAPPPTLADECPIYYADQRLASVAAFTDGSIRVNAQFSNGAWGGWQSIGGSGFDNVSAVLYDDQRIAVLAVGTASPVWVRAQSAANGSWGSWASLGGPDFSFVRAVKMSDERLVAVACGQGTAVWVNAQTAYNSSWGGFQSISGSGFRHLDAVRYSDDRLVVVAVGSASTVWVNAQIAANGSWGGWQSLGGPTFSYVRALMRPDGRMIVVASGNETAIYINSQTAPSGPWTGWQSLGGGGFTRADPVLMPDGRLAIFGVGIGTEVWVNAQFTPEGQWGGWQSIGGIGFGTAKGVLFQDGRFVCFGHAYGTEGWINWQTSVGGSWNGWMGLGGTLK